MKLFVAFAALAIACVSAASLESILRPGFPEGRIINGHPADKGEAPFIVSLKTTSHFCGGSIIDQHWVITAAHCLVYANFEVVAGLHQRSDESEVQIRQVRGSKYQFAHEMYGGSVGPHDIGLIYIEEAFDLNALARDGSAPVAKISLPTGKYTTLGDGKLFGWGRDNSGALPNTLQTLDVNVIGYSECKAALPFLAPIADVNICSYNAGTTDGACNGDSGGPLTVRTQEGYELVGLVSWGYTPCATTSYPSVYTSVSSYMDWIAEKMTAYQMSL
uniref:Putative trypsin-like serine protease n=1 Tax=Haematobia irritans TaxID=7368 RepID=A0A1L8E6U3_HAEIR